MMIMTSLHCLTKRQLRKLLIKLKRRRSEGRTRRRKRRSKVKARMALLNLMKNVISLRMKMAVVLAVLMMRTL